MIIIYVDDVRQFSINFKPGTRFNLQTKRFEITEEMRNVDLSGGKSKTKMMEIECRKAMNSINPDIQFTTEVAEDYPEQRLPTLDTYIWVDEFGIVRHSYFQKGMKSPLLLMQESAMSDNQKFAILSNELIRRVEKVGEGVPQDEKLEITERFIQEMINSGYARKNIRETVISGLKGFNTRFKNRMAKHGTYYRSAKQTLSGRNWKKLTQNTTWFKERDEEDNDEERAAGGRGGFEMRLHGGRITKNGKKEEKRAKSKAAKAVIFVQYTKGNTLAKRMREVKLEEMTGYKMKIVERGGSKLEDILVRKNPWEGETCGRKLCFPCMTKEKDEKIA